MKDIRELARIVTEMGKEEVEVIDLKNLYDQDNKYNRLLLGALSGKYSTDQEAMQDIYGDTNQSTSRYRTLKMRLKGRMINALFFWM